MKKTIIASMVLFGAVAAWAADPIKPLDVKLGLWETTASVEMAGMPKMQAPPSIPPEVLAKMSPEQRARMEAMIKAHAGGGPMTSTTKFCVTKESLGNPMTFNRPDKACTYTVVNSTSTKLQTHVECTREAGKTSGDLTLDRIDSEHTKGNMVMKNLGGPQPVETKMAFQSKWVSPDCGDAKPPVPR